MVDGEGNTLATFDYTPYGELLAAADSTAAGNDYLFAGKEQQGKLGASELYDSQARFMGTDGRFLSIDPLAENYYHVSPYAYCASDPVNLVDPDGRMFGDFVDNKGRIIGNDGIDDRKVYVLLISKGEVFENSINGSKYSLNQLRKAKTFIEDYSGNADVFSMHPEIYDYFIEIVGNKDLRQEMVKIVSQDDGSGSWVDDNRREYGGFITNNTVNAVAPGEISNENNATIKIPGGFPTFHTHPSGIDYQNKKVFQQHPTVKDIINSEEYTSYVFGRLDGIVYIYNNHGILSTIPHNFFVDFKK